MCKMGCSICRRRCYAYVERRHGYRLEKDEMVYLPNVVSGLIHAVWTISEPGDEIIIMTPVYGPLSA